MSRASPSSVFGADAGEHAGQAGHGGSSPLGRAELFRVQTSDARFLLIAFVAAFLVRGLFLALRGDYLWWDEAMYLLLARNVAGGDGLLLNGLPHTALGPGLPLLTALFARVPGLSPLSAQRTLNAVAGACLLLPVWYLVRSHTNRHTARLSCLLLIAWPALIDFAPKGGPMWRHLYFGSEPVFLLCLFTFLAAVEGALSSGRRRRWLLGAVAGLSLGLAYLVRAEAPVYGALYLLVRAPTLLRRFDRGVLAAGVAAAVGFGALAGPNLLRIQRVTGEWTVSGQLDVMGPAADLIQDAFHSDRHLMPYLRAWYAIDPSHTYLLNPYFGTPEGMARDRQVQEFESAVRAQSPAESSGIQRALDRAFMYGKAIWTLGGFFLPLCALGILCRGRRAFPPFVLVPFLGSLAIALYLLVTPRFLLALVPPLAFWAASGLRRLEEWLDRRELFSRPIDGERSARGLALAAVVTGLLVGAIGTFSDEADRLRAQAAADRGVASDLGAVLEGTSVISWHPGLAYWGNWEWRVMPEGSFETIVEYASAMDVGKLVLTQGGLTPLNLAVPYLVVSIPPRVAEAIAHARRESGIGLSVRATQAVAGYPTVSLQVANRPDEIPSRTKSGSGI